MADNVNKRLLILGAGGLGRMTLETALSLGYECFFLDDNVNIKKTCDTMVLGTLKELGLFVGEFQYCICAIGNNKIREEYTNCALSLGFIVPNIVSKTAYVSRYSKMGYGNILLNNVCVQNGSALGNGVVVTANSEIHHDCIIEDYSLIYSCSVVRTFAKIKKNVTIGSTVTISNSSIVPNNSVVADGSVL